MLKPIIEYDCINLRIFLVSFHNRPCEFSKSNKDATCHADKYKSNLMEPLALQQAFMVACSLGFLVPDEPL